MISPIDNPYAPPETPMDVAVNSPAPLGSIRRPTLFALSAVILVAGATSILTVLFHQFHFSFGGVNALAVATLVLTGLSVILAPMFVPAVHVVKALVAAMVINTAGWLVVIGVLRFGRFFVGNAPTLSPADIKLIGSIALACAVVSVIVVLFR